MAVAKVVSFEHLKDSWASFLQFLFLFLILDSASGNDRVAREYLRDCKDVHFLNVLLSDFGNTIYIYMLIVASFSMVRSLIVIMFKCYAHQVNLIVGEVLGPAGFNTHSAVCCIANLMKHHIYLV